MLVASEKEYELLKGEITEIRRTITRLLGFIISVAGLSGVLIRYFFENNLQSYKKDLQNVPVSLDIPIIIFFAMLVITLLFNLVWYKFHSHNRYVGYLQLLSQEIDHYSLKDFNKRRKNKRYLDNPPDPIDHAEYSAITKKENLFVWEFIMSRLNNAVFYNDQFHNISKALDKCRFRYDLPSEFKYEEIPDYKSLDTAFHGEIIYPLYGKPKKNRKEKIKEFVSKTWDFIFRDYIRLFMSSCLWQKDKRKRDYINTGWSYPKTVTQTSFIPILLLLSYQIYFVHSQLTLCTAKPIAAQLVVIIILSIAIFVFWNLKFLRGLYNVMHGNKSIDSFCWTFFIYRTQMLNRIGIVPNYFSRSFIRFYKSKYILTCIERDNEYFQNLAQSQKRDIQQYKKHLQEGMKLGRYSKLHDVINTKLRKSS